MGLKPEQLSADERIVIETREHKKHLVGAAIICLAAVVGLIVVLAIGPSDGFFAWVDSVGWLAFLVVIVIFGVWPFLGWYYRSYTLTTERLATRQGILRRSGRDIPLRRINDVAFDQGLLDRLVRAGTLKVSAASERGTIVMKDIPEIEQFTLEMNTLVREAGNASR
jgi:uncharacterized membrane protein YdbT with pleckstrin-like domain